MDWQEWIQTEDYFRGFSAQVEGLGATFQAPLAKVPFVQKKGSTFWMEAQEPLEGIRLVTTYVPPMAVAAPAYLYLNVWLYDRPEYAHLRERFSNGPKFLSAGVDLYRTPGFTNRTYMASLPHGVELYGINYRCRLDLQYQPGPDGLAALRQLSEAFCVYVRKVVNGEEVELPTDAAQDGAEPETSQPWASEEAALAALLNGGDLSLTERQALVKARIGQGWFRDQLIERWKGCSVTGCRLTEALVASHIVGWAECKTPSERWSVENGLLLTPALDKLFDLGMISFMDSGRILFSSKIKATDCDQLGVPLHARLRSDLTPATKAFLARHRAKHGFIE